MSIEVLSFTQFDYIHYLRVHLQYHRLVNLIKCREIKFVVFNKCGAFRLCGGIGGPVIFIPLFSEMFIVSTTIGLNGIVRCGLL
jgi:hypothetical protein